MVQCCAKNIYFYSSVVRLEIGFSDFQQFFASREDNFQKWQERRTALLIPNLWNGVERKYSDTNFYLTQMLSGHDYFQKYLHKMAKKQTVRYAFMKTVRLTMSSTSFLNVKDGDVKGMP